LAAVAVEVDVLGLRCRPVIADPQHQLGIQYFCYAQAHWARGDSASAGAPTAVSWPSVFAHS
jgi:hypothetical protein